MSRVPSDSVELILEGWNPNLKKKKGQAPTPPPMKNPRQVPAPSYPNRPKNRTLKNDIWLILFFLGLNFGIFIFGLFVGLML